MNLPSTKSGPTEAPGFQRSPICFWTAGQWPVLFLVHQVHTRLPTGHTVLRPAVFDVTVADRCDGGQKTRDRHIAQMPTPGGNDPHDPHDPHDSCRSESVSVDSSLEEGRGESESNGKWGDSCRMATQVVAGDVGVTW